VTGPTIGQRLGALWSAVAVVAIAAVWLVGAEQQGLDRHDYFDTVAEQQAAQRDG
jgi:hypothetical protein